ncbi:MAG TPA: asparagine synthase (glutamine-hydrolyzing) [Chitinophagaceae bacterium]|nr:asparagine synthase (glutamine-hydrolyzing) [Chitinophagaceae bacterium]HNF47631.1 asparagine synthase (glutamine-hydrolyzing) [Chitinophagaceae bacterium]HNJ57299.1 asparagine synthase (glutamine-hydrolyzing) [Chitinophagaceae bacterium]HNK62359.1 asparagine synthase (glutamine-hydrolyzing) [Chitinophagaceae bacterium]HNO55847.1 asparagine synthase (glutamine-hydrolyzing) [Chitinophagaceae bacterium]
MCGITGFVDFNGNSNIQTLKSMSDALLHRGPDDEGHEIINHHKTQIGFGFRRLAIIDLTAAGHQPMKSPDGRLTIIFNGEIYNHAELRTILESKGHSFKSHSDTEVILHSYMQWGISCIEKFTGMFAIALHDSHQEKLFLIRDRAGVKPLFWYFKNDLMLFGSELKVFHQHDAFKKEIDRGALSLYFQHGYIPAPHCIFCDTYKLIPGHFLTIDLKNKNVQTTCYWNVTDFYNKPKLKISESDAIEETEKILSKAFKYRMVADVPVGVFLSGGYDSSLVTALLQKDSMQKIKTFTIGFEEESYNEAPHARKVAAHLGTEHHEFTCTYQEAMDIIPLIPEISDEPLADSSIIPTYLVSKLARKQVTVALSADGGDETFAGYTKYAKALNYLNKLKQLPSFAKSLSQIPAFFWQTVSPSNLAIPDRAHKLQLILKARHPVEAFNIITQGMTQLEVQQLLLQPTDFPLTPFEEYDELKVTDLLDNFLWLDYKTFLPDDILQKVDRATMAVSLEGREPLLDHHIIEWAAQLPSEYKLTNGVSKFLIRKITHKYIPKEIMEREKMGFNIPYEKWFKAELKELLIQTLDSNSLNKYQILNTTIIEKITKTYFLDTKIDFQRLWSILVFQLWFNKWMK